MKGVTFQISTLLRSSRACDGLWLLNGAVDAKPSPSISRFRRNGGGETKPKLYS